MSTLLSTFRQWLRHQALLWRASAMAADANRRWPTLRVTEPVLWTDTDLDAVDLGKWVHIGPFSEILARTVRKESNIPGGLQVGDCTCIGAFANIRAVGGKIVIGRNCLIAQHVSLIASNHNVRAGTIYSESGWEETKTGVTIGNNVWIGSGVTVLPGCRIGDDAVIGAGSVVTKDVTAGTIWVGNPARLVRTIGECLVSTPDESTLTR